MSGTRKKTIHHHSEEKMSRDELAKFLRQLADRVESGTVVLTGSEDDTTLEIAKDVELELKYQTKTKAETTTHELELEIEWGDASEGVGVK